MRPSWVCCSNCVTVATARASAVAAFRVLHVGRKMRRVGKGERRMSSLQRCLASPEAGGGDGGEEGQGLEGSGPWRELPPLGPALESGRLIPAARARQTSPADRLSSDDPGQGDGKRPWPLEEKGQEIQEGDVGRDKNRVKR